MLARQGTCLDISLAEDVYPSLNLVEIMFIVWNKLIPDGKAGHIWKVTRKNMIRIQRTKIESLNGTFSKRYKEDI